MKHLLLVLFLLGLVNINTAQIYKINSYNGQTITTCKGQIASSRFVSQSDNGYNNNENYTVTFCSESGTLLRVNFNYIDLEAGYDKLEVFDGPTVASPLLVTLSGSARSVAYTSTGTCLTFRFKSDAVTAVGDGFLGFLGCPPIPCGTNPVASDECLTAPTICDLNGYCGTTSGWYTADHRNLNFNQDNIFCGAIENNSWVSFVASATTASFNITSSNCSDPTNGIQAMITATNCTTFVSKDCELNGIGTFSVSATGLTIGQKYYIMIDGYAGNDCDYTVQATSGIQTVSLAPVGVVNTICPGQSLTLKTTVTGAAGTPTYTWSPAPVSGQGTNTATYAASATTYSCTVSGACGGIVTTYTPKISSPPTVSIAVAGSSTICTGGTGKTLTATGVLGESTVSFNNNNTKSIPDNNATGITSTLVVSGISGTVSSQLTSVCINISHGNDAHLDISLKSPNGTIIDLSSDNGGSGNNYTSTCFSSSGPSITTGTAPFTGAYTPEQALSLLSASAANGTWSLIVKDDTPTDVGLLTDWSLNFQNNITYSWSPSTGLSTTTGAVVTATPTSTTTYTVTAEDKGGCSGIATSTITVVTTPTAPTVTSPVKYCTGATASALTATGTNLLWYTVSAGGAGSSTAPTPSTVAVGTTNYYVSQTTVSCEGPRTLIAVQVSATPSAPTVTSSITYCQNESTVALIATGSNLLWYTVSSGGTGSSTAPTPSSAAVGTTNYYVSQTVGTCESARTLIKVIVNTTPAAPTVSNISYCKDAASIALTATGSNLLWYTVATGGAGSSTAPTPPTATVGTKNYYVSQKIGICEGPRATITVTINAKSNASFTYSNSTFCITGTNPTPTITGLGGGTFTAPAGLTINATTGLITLSSSTLGTYTVTYQVGGSCPNSAIFDVTITNSPNANFTYASANYCQYGIDPTPKFSPGASSGTFSATPAGLVFVNSSTGVIDLTASTAGITYVIKNTIAAADGCAAATSSPFNVTINPSPTITNSNAATVCSGVKLNIVITSVVPASYNWIADPSSFVTGESTSSVSSGVINDILINTTNIPQVVVYNVSASTSANCVNLPAHIINVTVNPAPHLTTDKSATMCTGEPLLIGLNSNLSSTYSWHAINNVNVTGESISNKTTDSIKDVLVHTKTVAEKVIYIVQSQSVAGACYNIIPDSIVVTVNPAFVLTNALTSNVCSGTPLSIALSSTGTVNYSWIATANNANVTGESLTLQTNNTINNTLVNTSNNNQLVNYAVTVTSLDNCVSPSKTIGVTVYPVPRLTNANTATVCSGTPLNIVLAGNVNSTYTWSASDNTNTTGETTTMQSTGVIKDIIFNKTNSAQEITYTINLVSDTGSCVSGSQVIKVTVNPEPTSLNANTEEVCSGVPLAIGLISSINSTYNWHAINNVNVTGESIINQTTDSIRDVLIHMNTVSEKVIYIVQSQSVSGGCYNTSPDSIAVTVNPSPKITNSNTAVTCSGVPLNIVLSSNLPATYKWIAADNINVTGESTGSVSSGVINDSLINTTNVPQIVVYTVTASSSSSCINLVGYIISVTVNPAPQLTTAKTAVVCTGVPLTIGLASNPSSTYSWQAINNVNVTGESISAQTTDSIKDVLVHTNTVSEKVIYLVQSQSVSGGCYNTTPDSIAVTVNPAFVLTNALTSTVCSGTPLSIALGSTGSATYSWIATANNVNVTGESLTSQTSNTINNTLVNTSNSNQLVNYAVTVTSLSNCASPSKVIGVTVYPAPKLTNANTAAVCSGTPLNIVLAANVNSTYKWSASDNTNVTGETTSIQSTGVIRDSLINNTSTPQLVTYTVNLVSDTNLCLSQAQTITVTVNPKSNASFTYSNSTFCKTGTNPTPTITGITGGTFTAPAGLSINASTGLITLSTSILGTYRVTYQVGGTCPNSATFDVTITDSPNANFSYANSIYCQYSTNPAPIFSLGASGGTFSATPAGLVFVNSSTGVIDLTASTAGITYTITNTIAAGGGCAAAVSSPFTVTINPSPTITNSNIATVCSGTPLNIVLSSNIPATYTWVAADNINVTGESTSSVNTGIIKDNLTNTTNVPQIVVYTVNALSSANCLNLTAHTIIVTVNPAPYITTAQSAVVCSGVPLTIGLTSSINATYSWQAIDNVNVIGESISSQTTDSIKDVLLNNNTVSEKVIYIVQSQSVSGGCYNTNPDSIAVTVNPSPKINNSNTAVTCSGVPLNIVLSSNLPATYNWIAADNINVTGESTSSVSTGIIKDNLTNTTNVPQLVVYTVTASSSANCINLTAHTITVTVNPAPQLTTAKSAAVCAGVPLAIGLISNINSTYSWQAIDNVNVTGESISNQTTDSIKDILVNNNTVSEKVIYIVQSQSVSGGCFNTSPDSIAVTVNPSPKINNSNTAITCSGVPLNIVLSSNLPVTYNWIAADNINVTGESTNLVISGVINDSLINTTNVPQVVVYTLTASSSANCMNLTAHTISVTVSPAPQLTTAKSAVICTGVPLTIGLTSSINSTYNWQAIDNVNVTGESVNTQTTDSIKDVLANANTVSEKVIYLVQSRSVSGGCSNTSPDSIAITINPSPKMSNGNTAVICSGEPLNILLSSNLPASYSWVATDNVNVTGETVSPSIKTIIKDTLINKTTLPEIVYYSLMLTSVEGNCLSSAERIVVTVNPGPALSNVKTATICSGEQLNITLNSTLNATYSWKATNNLHTTGESYTSIKTTSVINDVIVNKSIIPQLVVYTVNVQLGTCKSNTPQIIIATVNPTPVADTASLAIDSSDCGINSGAITGIAMASGMAPLKYVWKNGGGGIIDTALNLSNVGPGIYILTITDANGCSAKVGANKTLKIVGKNKVVASFTPSPTSGEMPLLVTFTNNSIGANHYSWSFDEGTSALKDPTYLYDKVGKFNACLIADNNGNCADTICKVIEVYINSVFIIPNVFTPNNDGVNDLFTISGKGIESLHAEIYNRWGQKEYEWNTTNGGWDGRSATGLSATSGTYYYIIKAVGLDGKKYLEKGSLTLIK